MVAGVSEGFKKELEMRGVGYRAQLHTKLVWLLVNPPIDEVEAQNYFGTSKPNNNRCWRNFKEEVGQTAAYVM